MEFNLTIATDFTTRTGLRHCRFSDNSGEEFYHEKLNPLFAEALRQNSSLTVNLDGVRGYAPSFLDESFGNLVYDFTLDVVKKFIKIISTEEKHWIDMLEQKTYIQWEKRRKQNDRVVVTKDHQPWVRLIDSKQISEIWEKP